MLDRVRCKDQVYGHRFGGSDLMTDVMTSAQRSYCMSRIRSKDTIPERLLRRRTSAQGVEGCSGLGA
jgi:hypothetical protein